MNENNSQSVEVQLEVSPQLILVSNPPSSLHILRLVLLSYIHLYFFQYSPV